MKIKNPEIVSELRDIIEQSPFYKSSNYSVNVNLQTLFESLRSYRPEFNDGLDVSDKEFLDLITPSFQRENNKWSREQQIRFMENLVAGYKTNLIFYSIGENHWDTPDGIELLDGLQRTTTTLDFKEGKFPIFEKFYYDDIVSRKAFLDVRLKMEVFQFENHIDACKHYIDVNRGITHSPEDLEVAYTFLEENGVNYRPQPSV